MTNGNSGRHICLLMFVATILLFLNILFACSSSHDDSANVKPSEQEKTPVKPTYDSVYNVGYGMYVVADDTIAYNKVNYTHEVSSTESAIKKVLNEFSVEMLVEFVKADERKNIIVSPVSATMIYSLMSNFWDVNKSNLFKKNMKISDAKTDDINSYSRKLLNNNILIGKKNDNGDYKISNCIWMQRDGTVYQSFLSMTNFYETSIKGIDFNNNNSISYIDSEIRQQTGRLNPEIGISDLWSRESNSIVTSSVSFKKEWETSFDVDSTYAQVFENVDGTTTKCKMLTSVRKAKYGDFDSFQMLKIPYKEGEFSMYILLPHQGKNLSQSLSDMKDIGMEKCFDVVEASQNSNDSWDEDTLISIRLPRFEYAATTALNPSSSKNSVQTAMYQENLPLVSPNGFKLNNIFQTCFIEVNELGTNAFAQTVGTQDGEHKTYAVPMIMNHAYKLADDNIIVIPFNVVRPFALFIRDMEFGSISFACGIETLK